VASAWCTRANPAVKALGINSGGGDETDRADVHELLGPNVVRVHDEGAVILLKVAAQLGIVLHANEPAEHSATG